MAQHQLGVTQHGIFGLELTADGVLVVGQMDHGFALGNRLGEIGFGEAAAHAKNQVRLFQIFVGLGGGAGPAGSQGQRMGLREAALARQGGHHRGLQEFGDLDQFGRGFSVQNALTGVDEGPVGGQKNFGGSAHISGVRLLQDNSGRLVVEQFFGQLGCGHIRRYLKQDRSWATGAQLGESPSHEVRYALDDVHLFRPLGDGLVASCGVEIGMDAPLLPGHASGQQQNGYRLRKRLGHAAEAVLRPRAVLHHEHAHLLAIGHSGVAIHHVDAGAFLPEDDGAYPGDSRRFQKGLVGDAADELNSLHAQDIGYGCDSVHVSTPWLCTG